jgi:hypothetical protein
MRNRKLSVTFALAAIALATLGQATHTTAQTFTVLYNFPYNSGPFAALKTMEQFLN